MDGWYGRIFRGCGFFDPDKPIREYGKRELHDLLCKEPTKINVDGINLTYEGLIPKIQKSFLSNVTARSTKARTCGCSASTSPASTSRPKVGA